MGSSWPAIREQPQKGQSWTGLKIAFVNVKRIWSFSRIYSHLFTFTKEFLNGKFLFFFFFLFEEWLIEPVVPTYSTGYLLYKITWNSPWNTFARLPLSRISFAQTTSGRYFKHFRYKKYNTVPMLFTRAVLSKYGIPAN